MRYPSRLTHVAVVVAALSLLSSCGLFDSGDDDVATPEAESEQEPQSPDDALAERAILTSSEFPEGWTEGEFSPGIGAALQQSIPECRDARALGEFAAQSSGSAGLRQFVSPGADRVDVSVWVFPDEPTATSVMTELEGVTALVTTCFGAILDTYRSAFGVAPDASIEPVFEADTGLGDQSATVTGPENADGEVTAQSTFVRVGRVVMTIVTVSLSPDADVAAALDAAVQRAQDAIS